MPFSLAHCFFVFGVLSSQRNTKTKLRWVPVTRRAAMLHGFFTCTLFLCFCCSFLSKKHKIEMGPVTRRAAILHGFFTYTLFLCFCCSFLSKKHKNKNEMGPSDQEGGHAAWLFHLHIVSLSLLFFPLKETQEQN